MRILSLNICILLFTFSVTSTAQEDKDRIPYKARHPLLWLHSDSVVLFGTWYGSRQDPSFLSPKLAKELYPKFVPPEYDDDTEDQGYPRIKTETLPVPKTGQKNLLLSMGYKPDDQLFMVFKDKSNKVVNSQLDLFKADLTIDLGFTLTTVKAIPEKNTQSERGLAWVANKNPFKTDGEIKTIPLVYRSPKQPLVNELNQKLIDQASISIKNEHIYNNPEFKPEFSCKSLPSKSASYDGVEFVLAIAECISTNDPDHKEPRKFSELFVSDDSKIWSLSFEIEGYRTVDITMAEITIFNVFNDYSFLLKDPTGDGGPGCDRVFIREKKGVWKHVEPACEPRGC